MSRHTRMQKTMRSPTRARRLRLRGKRQERLSMLLADAGLPETVAPEVRDRLIAVRKRAALTAGSQLRGIFGREGRPASIHYVKDETDGRV